MLQVHFDILHDNGHGDLAAAVCLNQSAAFTTVDREILPQCQKMNPCTDDAILRWLLTNLIQVVSQHLTVIWGFQLVHIWYYRLTVLLYMHPTFQVIFIIRLIRGVPQLSVTGPVQLLLICYIPNPIA